MRDIVLQCLKFFCGVLHETKLSPFLILFDPFSGTTEKLYEVFHIICALYNCHTFCEQCLERKKDIACLQCKQRSRVPTGGVKLFSANYDVQRIIEKFQLEEKIRLCFKCQEDDMEEMAQSYCPICELHLCNFHTTSHKKSSKTKTHILDILKKVASQEVTPAVENICKYHPSEKLELICRTCNDEFICFRCYTFDHRERDYISIKESRKILETEREDNAKMISEIEEAITSYQKVINEIDKKAKGELEKARSHTSRVIKAVENRENIMVGYVNSVQEATRSKLLEAKNELTVALNQAKDSMRIRIQIFGNNG